MNFIGKNFDDVSIRAANLEGTNASIFLQKVRNKSLYRTNCRGVIFLDNDFTGVFIQDTIFDERVRFKDFFKEEVNVERHKCKKLI